MGAVLLVSHEVRDFDAWKKGFDEHAPIREKAGFKVLFVGRDAARPNLVHAGFTTSSAEAAPAFVDDPNLKEAMAKAGVISAPDIRIVTNA